MAIRGRTLNTVIGLLFFFGAAAQAHAAACHDVIYRIWQKGKDDRYFAFGEEVILGIGHEAHLYIHYRSGSKDPYSTSTEIGYPTGFGLHGDQPQNIGKLLALQAQSDKDRADGRMIMTATKVGSTSLGYRIFALAPPGKLDQVPEACRVGTVRLKIVDTSATKPPDNTVDRPRQAAERLVVLLYQGLMRRQSVRNYPQSQVETVLNGGHQGAIELAVEMTGSPEFRDEIRKRTIAAHAALNASSSDRQVFEQLLSDIYRSLYGTTSITASEHARNLDDLALCLGSSDARRGVACERLGRGLIGNELFATQQAALLDQLRPNERRPRIDRDGRRRNVEQRQ